MAVAVLIVNYKAYRHLASCLDTLADALGAHDEVIVVDNESQAHALQTACARHPRVRAVPVVDNLGFAAGVNLAARQATAQYLLLLNPDAQVLGPLLRTLETYLEAHPEVAVVAPRIENGDGTIQPSARRDPGLTALLGARSGWLTRVFPNNWFATHNFVGLSAAAPRDVDWVTGACLLVRRDRFEALGGLDPGFFMYWEDADFCRRVREQGGRVVFLPTTLVRHQIAGSSSFAPARNVWLFHRSALRLYLKHAGFVEWGLLPLTFAALCLRVGMQMLRAARTAPLGGR